MNAVSKINAIMEMLHTGLIDTNTAKYLVGMTRINIKTNSNIHQILFDIIEMLRFEE